MRRTFFSLAILVFLLAACGNDDAQQTSSPSPSPVPSSDVVEYVGKSENFLFFTAVVAHP